MKYLSATVITIFFFSSFLVAQDYETADKIKKKLQGLVKVEDVYPSDYDNRYYVYTTDGKVGIVNKSAEVIVEIKCSAINITESGGYFLKANNKWYYANSEGKTINSERYDDIKFSKNDKLTIVSKGVKYGVLNDNGKNVVPIKFDKIEKEVAKYNSSVYFFKTQVKNKYGVIDEHGNEVIVPKYDEITLISKSAEWIRTKLNGKYGFADSYVFDTKEHKSGEIFEVFPPKYDAIIYDADEGFGSGFIEVKQRDKWGLVNEKSGKEITGLKYDSVNDYYFYQGFSLTTVKLNEKYGMINKDGKEVIPCKYDKILSAEGRFDKPEKFKVKLGENEFYINSSGQKVK